MDVWCKIETQLFNNGSNLIGTIDTNYLVSHFGVVDSTAPGYLITITGNFKTASFIEQAGSSGNFEVGFTNSVPEMSTWAMLIAGFIGLCFVSAAGKKATPRHI